MNISPDNASLMQFFVFMYNRQELWNNRYMLKKPVEEWTDDEEMRLWKFTNVHRTLDVGTLYLHQIVYPKMLASYTGGPVSSETVANAMLLATIFYRFYNKVETMQAVGTKHFFDCYSPCEMVSKIQAEIHKHLEKTEHTLFTNAHMVNSLVKWKVTGTYPLEPWKNDNKSNRFLKGFTETIADVSTLRHNLQNADSGKIAFDHIVGCAPGIGGFVGYEIWCDLLHTPLLHQFDENDFVNLGPGCVRGMHDIFPEAREHNLNEVQLLPTLLKMRDVALPFLQEYGLNYKFPVIPGVPQKDDFTLRDIEHSLCEFSKWFKAHNDKGRPRNKYPHPPEVLQERTEKYLKLFIEREYVY